MKEIKYLPLMCTRDTVVFPQIEETIEIGRPKTINAIDVANTDYNGLIAVVCQKDYKVDDPKKDDIFNVATVCSIKTIRRKGAAISVVINGVSRCVIEQFDFDEQRQFYRVGIRFEEETEEEFHKTNALKNRVLNKISEILDHNELHKYAIMAVRNAETFSKFADLSAFYFLQNYNHKQSILESFDVNERMLKIISFIMEYQEMENIEHEIDVKIRERIDDNQKEYLLKEKIRMIKEELEEDIFSDTEKLSKAFEENPFPEHVKNKAREEIRRLEMTMPSSGEASVIRSYLDWLYNIPWYQRSVDNDDLNLAMKILDEDHFGLKKVKERIMEYLAVKKMTNSLKAPIICLVGPPGVGKTSLAKSVARALDREFVKQSLGGVKDESEIRGHRRTYLGSLPGRIIQGMKKAKKLNPVFLIDEIDKMASDFRGDPSSAMLEVLDPEQNNMFSDNYIEEPYDLSNVLFIATANYIANIPPALLDRLEVIELSSYTEIEKVQIAQKHLIPKQLKFNGLKEKQIIFSDSILLYLIRSYTRESGVRNLERLIASLCRKACLGILKDNKKSFKLTKKMINEFLGSERFEFGTKNKKDEVGVVTGLAYTSYGGDILPIEVTYFEGKGKLSVTGQLGNVMKESTEIALDWVKSNAKSLGIDNEWFQKNDIHIHAPEGAIPKDGPSAGVTITSALVSAITNKKAKKDIAMTGEVTLRGNVLPIGGLKEKSLAAHRAGIKKILFPKANSKDLEEVPKEVLESIEFIPVTHVEQVLKEILL